MCKECGDVLLQVRERVGTFMLGNKELCTGKDSGTWKEVLRVTPFYHSCTSKAYIRHSATHLITQKADKVHMGVG